MIFFISDQKIFAPQNTTIVSSTHPILIDQVRCLDWKTWTTYESYGWERHYTALGTQGKNKGIDYDEFLESLESLNYEFYWYNHGEDFIYKTLTDKDIKANRLKSITYEYVPEYTNPGNGSGEWKKIVTIETGRSTEKEISYATMDRVEASAEWSYGGATVSGTYET